MGRRQRPVEWLGRTFTQEAFPTTPGNSNFLSIVDADESGPQNFSFEHYTQPTIVRCIGRLIVRLTTDSTASANYRMSYQLGLICCDEDLPAQNLGTELGHPWLWYDYGVVIRTQTADPEWNGTTVVNFDKNEFGMPIRDHLLDSRAMRKVPRDCHLRLVLRNAQEGSGAVSPTISGFIRVLVKE